MAENVQGESNGQRREVRAPGNGLREAVAGLARPIRERAARLSPGDPSCGADTQI